MVLNWKEKIGVLLLLPTKGSIIMLNREADKISDKLVAL